MTYDAVHDTLLNSSPTKVDAPQGKYIFHGYSAKGRAQLTFDDLRFMGIGMVQACDENHHPIEDQPAHVVPGYLPNKAKDKVLICQGAKNQRCYRFTGRLQPYRSNTLPTAVQPLSIAVPVVAPEPAPQVAPPKAQGRRAAKRPVSETYGQDLQRIRQSLDAGLDPDVRIDFIAPYLGESRANLYRKMKLTPPQFPNPIKRGHGSFWPFSLVEAYRKGEWKPQPATSKEASS